ncbi:protein kinase domain-containing protein [Rubripirellula tenax]|uniref:protein kinase domain-containing protein n=1 Tax=Rubripirellula tenax TaxID=2528015 RepID=UPI0016469F3C|nr:protein kinase [Rubripirellula tenax]
MTDSLGSIEAPTRLISMNILDRLRLSQKFTEAQLEIVRKELEHYYFDDDAIAVKNARIGMDVGKYVLESVLGEGGAGQVFRARSKHDENDHVALKLIKHARATDRFRREMELVLRLAHPNVVIAYSTGEYQDKLYIAMEELSGPDLHTQVANSGPITWQDSLQFILDAAAGLEHAHQRDLIHRDVKPGNLILDSGRVKVSDLGLAILTENGENGKADTIGGFHTQTGFLGGTPEFMAPEQARSLASATVQSDIYGLGATWYYLLTGKSRVSGKSLQEMVVNLIRGIDLKGLSDTIAPAEVRKIFDKMVSFRPEHRYRSMSEVIVALKSVVVPDPNSMQSELPLRNCIEVLIVEDDQEDMILTVEMLQRGNNAVNVVPAHTLREAIDVVNNKTHIDLILLDLQLPDCMGVDTVKRLRESKPDAPVIVLTGQNDVTVGKACIEAGADDFACKNDLTPHLLERIIFVTLSRYSRRNNPFYKSVSPSPGTPSPFLSHD